MRVNSVRNFAVNSAVNKGVNSAKSQKATSPSFGAIPLAKAMEVVQKSMFGFDLSDVDVRGVEKRLARRGIDADFSQGTEYARKFIAKSCEMTADIFEQLGLVNPKKVMSYDFSKIPNFQDAQYTMGFCTPRNWGLNPARTVAFNSGIDWGKYPGLVARDYAMGHSSTGHFLGGFAHEYAHSALIDNVYKRHGTSVPILGYKLNPNLRQDLANLSNAYGNDPRLKRTMDIIDGKISTYGTTSPHETFAEGLTKKIFRDHVDLITFKVTPFPKNPQIVTPEDKIIAEIWNGLVNDGVGLV